MDDLISRQSAITALSNEIVKRRLLDEMYDGCIDEFLAEEILKKLPSAQPEPCEDAVSRTEILRMINCINDHHAITPYKSVGAITEHLTRIARNLPPVTPEQNLDEWCTDCKEYDHENSCCPRWTKVIRQTRRELQDEFVMTAVDGTLWVTVDDVKKVGRVIVDEDKSKFCRQFYMEEEQRTGHWHITDAYPHNVYCSECHKRFAQTHWAVWEDGSLPRNFCPNCGAKMEGVNNESN